MNPKFQAKFMEREWVYVQGPDAARFLNGMLTADILRASNAAKDGRICGLSYFLNEKAKFIAELVFVAETPDIFTLSTPKGWGAELYEGLSRHLITDQVEMRVIASNESYKEVYSIPEYLEEDAKAQLIPARTADAKDLLYRVDKHNWGLVLPRGRLGARHAEVWIFSDATRPFEIEPFLHEQYRALRIKEGVPEWGEDLGEASFPLVYPLSEAISYYKGCYRGQEIIARGTYRGKIKRAFSRFHGEELLLRGDFFSQNDGEVPAGHLTTVQGNEGLGEIRLECLNTELFQKTKEGKKIKITSVELLIDKIKDEKN